AIDIIHAESNSAVTVNNRTNYKNYRGRLRLNENLATKAYDAEVIEGERYFLNYFLSCGKSD
ncbi:unnamed protein product, partial [Rotaria magnacalcarata]